jgi:putative monooxygenase
VEQTEYPKAERDAVVITAADVAADTRRGGEVVTLLGPKTAQSTSGFMGVATIGPGERISEHYHPYSEEFIYCVRGVLDAQLDDKSTELKAGQALLIPINMRHRLVNPGSEEAFIVFHLGPLAPDPKLGHVDTE